MLIDFFLTGVLMLDGYVTKLSLRNFSDNNCKSISVGHVARYSDVESSEGYRILLRSLYIQMFIECPFPVHIICIFRSPCLAFVFHRVDCQLLISHEFFLKFKGMH